jgi:hypothetical protein
VLQDQAGTQTGSNQTAWTDKGFRNHFVKLSSASMYPDALLLPGIAVSFAATNHQVTLLALT